MFKYELDQLVYFMRNNGVCNGNVDSRMYIDNLHEDWACTPQQQHIWTRWGSGCVKYVVSGEELSEQKVFASKADLLESL